MEDRFEVVPFLPDVRRTTTPLATAVSQAQSPHTQTNYAFFAIYDGHGGTACADYVHAHLHNNIVQHSKFHTDPETALKEGMKKTEDEFTELVLKDNLDGLTGTTACVALIHHNVLYVANVGDSAAILCTGGNVIPLSTCHTPKNPLERERIEKVKGVIVQDRLGHPAWNSSLINIALSRAFGNVYFKAIQFTEGKESGLIADPEIVKKTLTIEDQFVLLASDGFWDVVSPREATDYILNSVDKDPSTISKRLTEMALQRSAIDNTTVLLVNFQHNVREPIQ